MKQLLEFSGIEPERLTLKWVSSAEGPRFAQGGHGICGENKKPGAVALCVSRTNFEQTG